MTIRSQLGIVTCCLICLSALAGCNPSTPQLAPVQGRVLYRGQVLPYGTVVFVPDSTRGTHGNLAVGEIRSDGTFKLKTNDLEGAVPGHHKVTVSCVYSPGPAGSPQSPLPIKYRDPNQSGLSAEVIVGKNNTFDININ